MSIFDWLQIAIGFIRVVRRAIGRVALLLPWPAGARCTRPTEPAETAE
jgi:hypothetical protein